jgi:hypothetical protein
MQHAGLRAAAPNWWRGLSLLRLPQVRVVVAVVVAADLRAWAVVLRRVVAALRALPRVAVVVVAAAARPRKSSSRRS